MLSKTNITFVLLLVLVASNLSLADMRLCGKSLTQFLEVVCVDGFNTKDLRAKKSVPLIDANENGVKTDIQSLDSMSLFMDNLYSNYHNLMAKTRRRRFDGVADECCRKECAMSELLSYCL